MIEFLLLFVLITNAVPNFILFTADDIGYNDLSCYGSPTIQTPNLDILASQGLRFTQFYTPGPLCTPSRGAMLTGRLPIRTGLYTKYDYPLDDIFRVFYPSSVGCLPKSETTLQEYLKNSPMKYTTAMLGKWHLGHNNVSQCLPTYRGFDVFYGLPYSHEEGYPGPNPEALAWPPVPLISGNRIIQQPVNVSELPESYTSIALSLLEEWSQTRQPFFLHVAYEEAHVPILVSSDFTNKSRRGLYGDAILAMDDSIGKIMSKIRVLGLARNTLVVFVSDNGAWINPSSGIFGRNSYPFQGGCNAPFKDGKGSTWEGGVRVPGIFWWPDTIPSGVTQSVASMLDIVPTLLELAGVSNNANKTFDGYSLVPLLTGKTSNSPYQFFYLWREHTLYAIRYGPWKAHYYTRSGFGSQPAIKHDPPLLFNIEWDASELYPLNVSQYQDIYNIIDTEYQNHISTMTYGIPQYDSQNWTLIPCCNGLNVSNNHIGITNQWDLAMWDKLGCVCNNK